MHYAEFELPSNYQLDQEQVGRILEDELESLGFYVFLPTSADWGYTFRMKSNGQTFDISVIQIDNQKFGLALERVQTLLFKIFNYIKPFDSTGAKKWIDEVLGTDVGATYIKWYSAKSWKNAFGQDFWKSA